MPAGAPAAASARAASASIELVLAEKPSAALLCSAKPRYPAAWTRPMPPRVAHRALFPPARGRTSRPAARALPSPPHDDIAPVMIVRWPSSAECLLDTGRDDQTPGHLDQVTASRYSARRCPYGLANHVNLIQAHQIAKNTTGYRRAARPGCRRRGPAREEPYPVICYGPDGPHGHVKTARAASPRDSLGQGRARPC